MNILTTIVGSTRIPVEWIKQSRELRMKITEYLLVFAVILTVSVPSFSGEKKKRVIISDQFELTNLLMNGQNPTDVENEAPSTWGLLGEGPECIKSANGIL